MTGDEWEVVAGILEDGWPYDFGEDAYRLVLGHCRADAVLAAIRKLALGGKAEKRPSVGALAAALNEDPGIPSWAEVEEALLGPGGALRVGALSGAAHPVLRDFLATRTIERLSRLPFDDPDWGEVERRRLREDWERYAERAEQRRFHGLALESVGARNGELHQLRPLATLGIPQPMELTEGDEGGADRAVPRT